MNWATSQLATRRVLQGVILNGRYLLAGRWWGKKVLTGKDCFPGGSDGKESAAMRETGIRSLGQKDPWRREWLPTPVFLPGEIYGQGSLEVCSPWGCKELDTTE